MKLKDNTGLSGIRGDITTHSSEFKSIITYKQLCAKKFDNLHEMDKLFERYK